MASKLVGQIIPWLPVPTEFTSKDLSRDEAWQKATDQDPLYSKIVTPRYFTESNEAQLQALKTGPSIRLPVFVLCGERDPIASPAATKAFFETLASSDKNFKEYPGMLHEPMNELGKEEVWRDIGSWISKHT
jgi:lysophospholipase